MAEKTLDQLVEAFNVVEREMDTAMHDLYVTDRASWNDLINASMKNIPVTREKSRDMINGKTVQGLSILDEGGKVRDQFREIVAAVYFDEEAAWNQEKNSHKPRVETYEV